MKTHAWMICLTFVACTHRADVKTTEEAAQAPTLKAAGPWRAVSYEDTRCDENAACAAVPAGPVCGGWRYMPIRAERKDTYAQAWEEAGAACETPSPQAAAPNAVCNRATNLCVIDDATDFACVEAELTATGTLPLSGRKAHGRQSRGCAQVEAVTGEDVYFTYTAEVDGAHTLRVNAEGGPVAMQVLAGDCQADARVCKVCAGPGCEVTRQPLRKGDSILVAVRNCTGDCAVTASLDDI